MTLEELIQSIHAIETHLHVRGKIPDALGGCLSARW
jgi:hypothetical protein